MRKFDRHERYIAAAVILVTCLIALAAIDARMNTPEKVAMEIINSCEEVDSDCFRQCFQRDLTTARICVELYNTIQKEEIQ